MNKKTKIISFIALSGLSATAVAISLSYRGGNFSFFARKVAAEAGPVGTIGSVSFYENSSVATQYGVGTGLLSDYKLNQEINISGGSWLISAGAYGRDNPAHLIDDNGNYNTLFTSSIWSGNESVQVNNSTLTADGVFKDHLDDFQQISDITDQVASINIGAPTVFNYKMILMSTTTFTNIKDFAFFWRYSTNNIGVVPAIKVKGTSTWASPWYGSIGYASGTSYAKSGVNSTGFAISQNDIIDGGSFPRYYNSGFLYDDTAYHNFVDKEVQIAFTIYTGDQFSMDVQLDGIIINRHDSAMQFMNGLNDDTICSGGTITDKNIKKCFELFDRAFDSAYVGSETDVGDLANYSIDHTLYPELRENDYYSQYQFLHSKLA